MMTSLCDRPGPEIQLARGTQLLLAVAADNNFKEEQKIGSGRRRRQPT
jgi:hypothetical protein